MTTDPHDEHGEILRRALQAEAESVIPAADGLERIRTRIDERSRSRLGRAGLPGLFGGVLGSGTGAVWARPVLAVAAAALIAGIGVTAPQTIELIQSAADKGPSSEGHRGGPGDGAPGTLGGPPNAQQPAPPGPSESGAPADSGSPSPETSLGSTACAAPNPTPTVSGTPKPNATGKGGSGPAPCPGGSPSPSPSPSPSDTDSEEPNQPTTPADPPPTSQPAAPAKAEQPAA